MTPRHRIDVHHHIVPQHYAAWLRDKGLTDADDRVPKWSARAAIRLMDTVDVRAAVLSLSVPSVWFGDAAEADHWAREVNEYTAGIVAEHPGRFGHLATLPLPDVKAAITAADHALDVLHADGIVLLANYDGHYLGEPLFAPLLHHLSERGAVVLVHPGRLLATPAVGIPSFTADFLLDTARTAISLILTGGLDRYRGIRFILSHAGGFVPYIVDRILLAKLRGASKLTQARLLVDQRRLRAEWVELVRRFYFDVALSSTAAAMPSLLAVADPTRILYGTDYPFAPAPVVRYMAKQHQQYPLDPATRLGIDHDNAATLFPRLFGAQGHLIRPA